MYTSDIYRNTHTCEKQTVIDKPWYAAIIKMLDLSAEVLALSL